MTKIKSPLKHEGNSVHNDFHKKYNAGKLGKQGKIWVANAHENVPIEEMGVDMLEVDLSKLDSKDKEIVDKKDTQESNIEVVIPTHEEMLENMPAHIRKQMDYKIEQATIRANHDKIKQQNIKTNGAINVGFGSTPADHVRADSDPSIQTISLTEEDYIVKYSDGGFDYSTSVDEALAHNLHMDKIEGTNDPFGRLGGENHFQIVLKTHKPDYKTTDAAGSTLLFPVDVSSYAKEVKKVQESDLSTEEKKLKIDQIINRYEDFIDLSKYHDAKDKYSVLEAEYEAVTGMGFSGSLESLVLWKAEQIKKEAKETKEELL